MLSVRTVVLAAAALLFPCSMLAESGRSDRQLLVAAETMVTVAIGYCHFQVDRDANKKFYAIAAVKYRLPSETLEQAEKAFDAAMVAAAKVFPDDELFDPNKKLCPTALSWFGPVGTVFAGILSKP